MEVGQRAPPGSRRAATGRETHGRETRDTHPGDKRGHRDKAEPRNLKRDSEPFHPGNLCSPCCTVTGLSQELPAAWPRTEGPFQLLCNIQRGFNATSHITVVVADRFALLGMIPI
ncbi:unnamed protein product [Pleuronectes platessa]|uniref:Uncharacterized protein n=1 Tax=Pleuronectes platessa TaxID=8262 RepID=A0A9N7YNN8_PLEPL|nr:unnamed protein product [Pleuronectes platessa]